MVNRIPSDFCTTSRLLPPPGCFIFRMLTITKFYQSVDNLFKKLDSGTRHPVVAIGLVLVSLSANVVGLLTFFGIGPLSSLKAAPLIAITVSVNVGLVVLFGLYRVHAENLAMKRCFYIVHAIAHRFRDVVRPVSTNHTEVASRDLLNFERLILNEICRWLSDIFWNLTKRKCHVCITLIEKKSGGESVCFPWARSEELPSHAASRSMQFSISNKNTRFLEALRRRPDGFCYFFSADLEALEKQSQYVDELENWKSQYLSCIVVPIQLTGTEPSEILGFLKVETLHKNRLNGHFHVQIVAALADQIYTFLTVGRIASPRAAHSGQ
jgi:hypothetical protein